MFMLEKVNRGRRFESMWQIYRNENVRRSLKVRAQRGKHCDITVLKILPMFICI